jgi:hypothetical protein
MMNSPAIDYMPPSAKVPIFTPTPQRAAASSPFSTLSEAKNSSEQALITCNTVAFGQVCKAL